MSLFHRRVSWLCRFNDIVIGKYAIRRRKKCQVLSDGFGLTK